MKRPMARVVFVFSILAVLFVSILAFAHYVGDGPDFELKTSAPRAFPQPHADEPPVDLEPSPRLVEVKPDPDDAIVSEPALVSYVQTAMAEWAPKPSKWCTKVGCTKDSTALRVGLSEDIAAIVGDEPPIFREDGNWAHTLALVATLAFFEGAFLDFVDDGRCNDNAWRARAWDRGEIWAKDICDNGHAYTLFQLHNEGYVLYDASHAWGWAHPDQAKGDFGIYGHTILADELMKHRRRAVRVVLHRLRTSVPTLCGYTGEDAPCPKGRMRAEHARKYAAAHPML
jgi:hypothetical protein